MNWAKFNQIGENHKTFAVGHLAFIMGIKEPEYNFQRIHPFI